MIVWSLTLSMTSVRMSDFRYKINQSVIVKQTIVKIVAAYKVEVWNYYAVNKFTGYLIREDYITAMEGANSE